MNTLCSSVQMDGPIRITLCGHVDAGKSTLAGHLLYKLGVFTDKDVENAKKKARENKMDTWYFAYLLDILEQEQLSGKTSDFIEQPFELSGRPYILIDTPGHHHLIPAMIAGADSTHIGLFVLSMKSSEFQKCLDDIEHIILFKCMGVKHLIVLMNKADLVDADTLAKNQTAIQTMLKRIGYSSATYLAISALNGDNVDKIIDVLKNIEVAPAKSVTYRTSQLTLKGIVLTKMISAGYMGVLHGNRTCHEVMIDSLRALPKKNEVGKKKNDAPLPFAKKNDALMPFTKKNDALMPFAKKNDVCVIVINFPREEEFSTTRFILRNADETVFLGTLVETDAV